MKRWLHRLGKVFLGLCLFWTLVHLVEDWRGKRAWEAWKKDQIAKGAIYDPTALASPPIPDADNFAKAPIIQERLGTVDQPLFSNGAHLAPPKGFVPGWRTGRVMDLNPWMEANHTEDLSAFLAPASSKLAQLAEATRRPGSRFEPARGEADPSMGLLGLRQAARILNLRALIALRSGKPDDALQDVLTELRLSRQVGQDSAFLAQDVQLALSGISMQAIWEGLQMHTWNEAQLNSLEEELSRQDELTPFIVWGWGERISTNLYWSNLATSPWWEKDRPFVSIVGHALVPRGWIYRNMLAADEHLAKTWLLAADPTARRMYPDKAEAIPAWWTQHRSTPYTFFAKDLSSILAGAVPAQAQRFADRQVAVDEALIVCALERYRLANKAYPDSLEALMPAYAAKLPCDVFTGASYRYVCKGDAFTLHSVGWNGTDEGGVMAMDGRDRTLTKGDWPWPQAAH